MKKALKRLFLIFLGLFTLIFLTIVVVLAVFFYNPTLFINPKNLDYTLTKTKVLDEWSWKKAEISHEWIAWNKRRFTGGFEDLCVLYNNPDVKVSTCLDKVSWNVELNWNSNRGFSYDITESLLIESSKLEVTPKDNPEDTPPPDLLSYWDILWSDLTPDFNLNFKKIKIFKKDSPLTFDLKVTKNPKMLIGEALGFYFQATQQKIEVFAPKKVLLPFDLKTKNPLYFDQIKIEALIQKTHIPVTATAKIESATIKIATKIRKEALKEDFVKTQFLSELIKESKGSLQVLKVKSTIFNLVRPPFNVLPAPINAMEGNLNVDFTASEYKNDQSVLLKIKTTLNMSGPKQDLNFVLNTDMPLFLKDNSLGPITLGLELKKVKLLLPKLSRTRLPPQLIPDKRFKNTNVVVKENLTPTNLPKKVKKNPAKDVDLNMHLQAVGENALLINTNLLDETLKLNFDLVIANGEIQSGFIQTFPLKTTVFKRKLIIQSVRLTFQEPLEPQIKATVIFKLPEYEVTLVLEGPISNPRQAFSSNPPLPLDDIYAVLLFGRPLSGLDPDDRTSARSSNQILSQGLLSLAVLYYFAGSPVESLGYDPESNELSAQIGLGSKNSLRVGGSGEGLSSAGVRRSLGKGWYIDSSVQKINRENGTGGGDYGVLLERVISY